MLSGTDLGRGGREGEQEAWGAGGRERGLCLAPHTLDIPWGCECRWDSSSQRHSVSPAVLTFLLQCLNQKNLKGGRQLSGGDAGASGTVALHQQ